jgi:TrmH family RNA methyltransferase
MSRVEEITSLANAKVKAIRALHMKKARDEEKLFVAEGLKLVIDALDKGWSMRTLVFAKTARGTKPVEDVAAKAMARGAQILIVSEKVLTAITRRDNPQAVIGVFEQRFGDLQKVRLARGDVLVALDRVRDPGNLGTVVRTADAAGAKGVVLVGDCTDPFSLEAIRATMGSVFAVPLYKSGEAGFIAWCQSAGAMVAGTHLDGAVDYRLPDYGAKANVLVMGNEQQGLTPALASACDTLVRIPQAGTADSLNLAVATGIMLFEIRRGALRLDTGTRNS